MSVDRVQLFRTKRFRWTWRVRSANGQVVSGPGQSFASKWNAKRSARRQHPDLPIEVL